MNRAGSLVVTSLVFLAIAQFTLVDAQAEKVAQPEGQVGRKPDRRPHDAPQVFVVCTGWHALCTASYDCRMKGDGTVDCDCMRVNEPHIVQTSAIQDTAVKRLTQAQCTKKHPCDVDEAPVCKAIQNGQYEVDNVEYDWVSTFSYRGWCALLQVEVKACDPRLGDYTGDRNWAVCDAAPCTENSKNCSAGRSECKT